MGEQILSQDADEESTILISADFADEDGIAVAPLTMSWKLTDSAGAVINDRSAVGIEVPAASVNIVLTSDDLGIAGSGDVVRILTLWGTYNSASGSALKFTAGVRFKINQLIGIA
ncbi:MAG: hypothetical protein ABIL58_25780 [Pseudomonadota bacterium]